jgi:hypothetical protein
VDIARQAELMLGGLVFVAFTSMVTRTYRWYGAGSGLRLAIWSLVPILLISSEAAVFGVAPVMLALAIAVLGIVLMIFPKQVIGITGGSAPLVQLGNAIRGIGNLCSSLEHLEPGPQAEELGARILGELSELERWRGPVTDEYISLFQESVRNLVAGTPWPDGGRKRERLYDLEREFRARLDAGGVGTMAWRWQRPAHSD